MGVSARPVHVAVGFFVCVRVTDIDHFQFETQGTPGERVVVEIEYLEDHLFKYKVDFGHMDPGDNAAALLASRPTNPTRRGSAR